MLLAESSSLVNATWGLFWATAVLTLATGFMAAMAFLHASHLKDLATKTKQIAESAEKSAKAADANAQSAKRAVAVTYRPRLALEQVAVSDYDGSTFAVALRLINLGTAEALRVGVRVMFGTQNDPPPPRPEGSWPSQNLYAQQRSDVSAAHPLFPSNREVIVVYVEINYIDDFEFEYIRREARAFTSGFPGDAVHPREIVGWSCDT